MTPAAVRLVEQLVGATRATALAVRLSGELEERLETAAGRYAAAIEAFGAGERVDLSNEKAALAAAVDEIERLAASGSEATEGRPSAGLLALNIGDGSGGARVTELQRARFARPIASKPASGLLSAVDDLNAETAAAQGRGGARVLELQRAKFRPIDSPRARPELLAAIDEINARPALGGAE